MKEGIRVKINKRRQIYLFKKFKEKLGNNKESARFLKIEYGTYKGYINGKVRYIPKQIINKICLVINKPLPEFLECKTLKEIRQITIKKTYPALKKKYGKNWQKIIAKIGHKNLQIKYGNKWRNIIAKKGHKTSKKLYGKNFQKIIWKKAIKSLERKYGKNWAKINATKSIKIFKKKYGKGWAKILMANARRGHIKKYGENWAKILSKMGEIKLREKYGENYHQRFGRIGFLVRKSPLTYYEKNICNYLKDNKIPFETHVIKNGREYDIIIPNSKNPKVVIESSNVNPTTHHQRIKIAQLFEQKKNFPGSIHLAILKRKSKGHNFSASNYRFLFDQRIFVFWKEDLKLVIKLLINYLRKKDKNLLKYKYRDFNEANNIRNSLGGALGCKNKTNYYEIKLNRLLKNINIESENQYVFQTKYGNSIAIDNLEEINNIKIAYEITNTGTQTALRSLIGKIIYLKILYKNIKFIVILTNIDKLMDNLVYDSLSKYSDVLILKNQFNKEGLMKARNQILSIIPNSLKSP